MPKKKWIITAIFILIPLITLWVYLQFFRPAYLFNEPQTVDVTVEGAREIMLTAKDQHLKIGSLELEFSGKLDGVMDIVLESKEGIAQIISLKGPKVERSFVFPWEHAQCTLIFAGRDNARGKFQIDYRFLEGE